MVSWLLKYWHREQYNPDDDPKIRKGVELSDRIDQAISVQQDRRDKMYGFVSDSVRSGLGERKTT